MIKNKLTSLLSASLLLAACSGPQNSLPTLNTGTAGLTPEQTSQNSEQINAPVIDDNLANLPADGGYRSLVIRAQDIKGADFKTKQVFAVAPKRNVTIRIGTVDYTLSYKFMNKLRTLLVNASYRASNGAPFKSQGFPYAGIVPAGFFTRLKAAATATVNSVASPAEPLWCPEIAPAVPLAAPNNCTGPNVDAYTLSASELAFTTLLESYNYVSLPDFLQEDESNLESVDSFEALTDFTRNISWVNTKTIRKEFYQKLHSYLNSDRNTANYTHGNGDYAFYADNLNPAATIVPSNIKTNNYRETISPPTGSLFRMNVAAQSTGGTTALATTGAPAPAATAAEKTLLTSLINQGPFVPNIGLISGNAVVLRQVGIGFGLNDTLALDGFADSPYEIALGYGTANINATANVSANDWSNYLPDVDNTPNFKVPAATANLNGAAAVMLTKLMLDNELFYESAVNAFGSSADYGTYTDGDKPFLAQWEVLFNTRALHMKAGKATATLAPASVLGFPAASTTVTGTTHLLTPTATTGATLPVIAELTTTVLPGATTGTSTASGVEFRTDILQTGAAINIFDALYQMYANPYDGPNGRNGVFKLGKSGASTNKNLLAITRFFHADDPKDTGYVYTDDSSEEDRAKGRALIVPVTRTVAANGTVSYTLNSTGTSFVIITATTTDVGNGDNSLSFYLTDPGYKPLEGVASVNISSSNPTLVAALYNYGGTLIGISANGF